MNQERSVSRMTWVIAVAGGLTALAFHTAARVDTRNPPTPSTAIAASPRTPDQPAASSEDERERRVRALHRAQLQLYTNTFDEEVVDVGWAPAAETEIRSVLDRAKRPVKQARVQCKSTLCRVEFSYEQPKDGRAVLQRMLMDHPWRGAVFTKNDAENQSAISYYTRQGRAFPRVEPRSLTR
ncbi:MAG TPA: hypothetical protein VER11_10085 [Polyangiaceae bacterium]|nr:hypothetical protein [Polyangiaceae bacterium]